MSEALPIPDLEGHPLTVREYQALLPERIELIGGYLLGPAEDHDQRLKLLAALLKNEGLLIVIRLVPYETWQEALRLAYKRGGA